MVQTNITDSIKTRILFFNNFFFSNNRAVYEIMWKIAVQAGRPQMTTWRMGIAC